MISAGELNGVRILNRETVSLMIVKEGKEASQGVGYLPDGTMVVVDGGRDRVGQTVRVQVSSVLQTNAGRMIFARMAEKPAEAAP